MRRLILMLLVAAGHRGAPECSQCRGLHGEQQRRRCGCRAGQQGLFDRRRDLLHPARCGYGVGVAVWRRHHLPVPAMAAISLGSQLTITKTTTIAAAGRGRRS